MPQGKTEDNATFMLYIPHSSNPNETMPLLVIFSPDGNAEAYLKFWQNLADKYHFIIYSSKEYKNGFNQDEIKNVQVSIYQNLVSILTKFPVDKQKIIFTGLSGGGIFAQSFSLAYPSLASAIIVNCSAFLAWDFEKNNIMFKINERNFKNIYKAKTMIFLASSTDYRYQLMKESKELFSLLGSNCIWLEFQGGHTMAPQKLYEEALTKYLGFHASQ